MHQLSLRTFLMQRKLIKSWIHSNDVHMNDVHMMMMMMIHHAQLVAIL